VLARIESTGGLNNHTAFWRTDGAATRVLDGGVSVWCWVRLDLRCLRRALAQMPFCPTWPIPSAYQPNVWRRARRHWRRNLLRHWTWTRANPREITPLFANVALDKSQQVWGSAREPKKFAQKQPPEIGLVVCRCDPNAVSKLPTGGEVARPHLDGVISKLPGRRFGDAKAKDGRPSEGIDDSSV